MLKQDNQCHCFSKIALIELRIIGRPCFIDQFSKFHEVSLGTLADYMRHFVPCIANLGQVRLCNNLAFWILQQELAFFCRSKPHLRLQELALGSFIEPLCFVLCTSLCRSKNSAGMLFHSDVEGMCREEVCIRDLVLAVGGPRNISHKFGRTIHVALIDLSKLHLYIDTLQISLVFMASV